MRHVCLFLFYYGISVNGIAQTTCTGVVLEYGNLTKLSSVHVQNLANKETAFSDNSGKFVIKASVNDVIVFSHPGYISDTLFLINLDVKRIYLLPQPFHLNTVTIVDRAFDPRRDYPEAYVRGDWLKLPAGGGITFSPSRLLGKKGRDARHLKRRLEREVIERQIDTLFSKKLVSGFIPLKGRELEDFMSIYRPTLGFLKNASPQDLLLYINDCYKRYKRLPAEQRTLPKLTEN
jgi:hypothetical protein